jgi:hypothetical protein
VYVVVCVVDNLLVIQSDLLSFHSANVDAILFCEDCDRAIVKPITYELRERADWQWRVVTSVPVGERDFLWRG